MRPVLDTNVVTSAAVWGGTPRLLRQAGREKRVDLFTSAARLAEHQGVHIVSASQALQIVGAA